MSSYSYSNDLSALDFHGVNLLDPFGVGSYHVEDTKSTRPSSSDSMLTIQSFDCSEYSHPPCLELTVRYCSLCALYLVALPIVAFFVDRRRRRRRRG